MTRHILYTKQSRELCSFIFVIQFHSSIHYFVFQNKVLDGEICSKSNRNNTFYGLFFISKSALAACWKTKMLGKIDFQYVNNLVHILIMGFVDSSTVLFHGSHIEFSSAIMLLSVCFIYSLSWGPCTVIPNYPSTSHT